MNYNAEDSGGRERFPSAYGAMLLISVAWLMLSPRTWLFAIPSELNDVFQKLVDTLGVEHHAFSATDIFSGEGLAYCPRKQVVYEIYAAKPEFQRWSWISATRSSHCRVHQLLESV